MRLLNVLLCTEQPPQYRILWPQTHSAEMEKLYSRQKKAKASAVMETWVLGVLSILFIYLLALRHAGS